MKITSKKKNKKRFEDSTKGTDHKVIEVRRHGEQLKNNKIIEQTRIGRDLSKPV